MNVKQKILIADDSGINRALLMEILGDGYEYLEAENGVRAVELLREHTDIALVLLDIMLPVMDGWSVLKKIRESSKVPVIMLTAKGETTDKVTGLEMGADDYITCRRYNMEMVVPVDDRGYQTKEAGKYAGMYYAESNGAILADMKESGLSLIHI